MKTWDDIAYLFSRVSTADLGCQDKANRQAYVEKALAVGATDTGKTVTSGRIIDFRTARTPDRAFRCAGVNKYSHQKYEYFIVVWENPDRIELMGGDINYAPRHQYDGYTERLW